MSSSNGRGAYLVRVAGALGLFGAMSCLVPDTNYCAFVYGDASCSGEEGLCVLAKERAPHDGIENGCSAELPDGFVHVRYGLPIAIAAPAEQWSVRGVLDRLGYDDCGSLDELDAHFGPVIGGVAEVRKHLEERGRVRRAAVELDRGHVVAIVAFEGAMEEWIEWCSMEPGTETDTSSTGVGETETDAETTASTTGEEPCTNDAMCSGETPFCELDSGECVTCDGMTDPHAACASLDMGSPVCLGGICVECTAEMPDACTGEMTVCDDDMNTCVPCTAHEQCGEAACNLFTGACLPTDAVVRVGPGQRFTTLTGAMASFAEDAEGTIIVEAGAYDESLTVGGSRVLAFLAAELGPGIDPPRWVRTAGNAPQLTVSADGTVLMDGIQLPTNISTSQPGVRLNGGRAWLDRAQVVANPGGGIVAESSAELVLRNCFVGGDVNDRIALEVTGATATLVYTTIATGFGASSALACDATATVNVRSSLLVSRSTDDEVACAGADIQYSATESDLGATNIGLGPVSTTWFVDYAAGDFHLARPHPPAIDTAAQWQFADPPTDIDGEPRPTADGSPDHAGADVP